MILKMTDGSTILDRNFALLPSITPQAFTQHGAPCMVKTILPSRFSMMNFM